MENAIQNVVGANRGRTVPHPFVFFLANGWDGATLNHHPVHGERNGPRTLFMGSLRSGLCFLGQSSDRRIS
jgi:hypothetical protein